MGIALEGPEGGLNDADFIKISANSFGLCSVRDYWAGSPSDISLDISFGGTDNAISSFCDIAGGYLNVQFKRRLDTGDTFDRPFLADGYTNVLFIYDEGTTVVDPATMRCGHVLGIADFVLQLLSGRDSIALMSLLGDGCSLEMLRLPHRYLPALRQQESHRQWHQRNRRYVDDGAAIKSRCQVSIDDDPSKHDRRGEAGRFGRFCPDV